MTLQTLKAYWRDMRGAARERFEELTGDDLVAIDGDYEYLVAALQQRYGWDGQRAAREIEAFVTHWVQGEGAQPPIAEVARAALGPGARKIKEGLREIGAGVRDLSRDGVDRARAAANAGGERVADSMSEVGALAREQAAAVSDQATALLKRTEAFVRERPLTSLGIAFAAGWLLFGRR